MTLIFHPWYVWRQLDSDFIFLWIFSQKKDITSENFILKFPFLQFITGKTLTQVFVQNLQVMIVDFFLVVATNCWTWIIIRINSCLQIVLMLLNVYQSVQQNTDVERKLFCKMHCLNLFGMLLLLLPWNSSKVILQQK